METKLASLSRRYQASLQKHLDRQQPGSPQAADRLGREALNMGLETLDLARIHEQALAALTSSSRSFGSKDGMLKRAQTFFIEALTRIEKTHRAAMETDLKLNQLNETLRRRTVELAAKNRQLKKEVLQRKTAEKALKKSEQRSSLLLEQSHHMQEQLRHLSRRILSVQEDERSRISHDLHDEVAQVMMGINLHLETLKKQATTNTKDLKRKITRTQRLVERSVLVVHRFADQLRPPALDDLGLFSALHSYTVDFAEQTGLSIHFTSFTRDRIEDLHSSKRTVLYRIVQESLTNVAKHAKASIVEVKLLKRRGVIIVEIKDDGKSFKVQDASLIRRKKGLGLLGMRERVEMIGGRFTVESSPGKGTTIRAEIPLTNGT